MCGFFVYGDIVYVWKGHLILNKKSSVRLPSIATILFDSILIMCIVRVIVGEWCKGSTSDFDSLSHGSNPCSPATNFGIGVEGHTVVSFRLARER